jgi:ABC-type multidrug transport system fused ATPase/permease subunit
MISILKYIKKIILISNLKYFLFFLFFLIIFSSALDIFSIVLIIPIVNLIFDSKSDLFFNSYKFLADLNLKKDNIILFFLILFFFKTITTVIIYKFIVKIKLNLQATLRLNLINKYQKSDYAKFIEKQTSNYIHNITSVVSQYSNGLMSLLRLFGEFIIILSIILYLIFFNDFRIFNLILIFISIIFLYQFLLKEKITSISKKINSESRDMIQLIKDSLIGFKEIKIINKESFFNSVIKEKTESLAKNGLFFEVILFLPRYVIEFLFVLMFTLFLFFNLENIISNNLEFTQLAATLLYAAFRIIPSISAISKLISMLNNAVVPTNILYEDLFDFNKQSFNKEVINLNNKEWKFKNIYFEKVSFEYTKDKIILQNSNLKIENGENTLLMGASGSGKSTIVDLIFKFYKPSSGKILINGLTNQNFYLKRDSFYLSQNRFLFNDTIMGNIIMSRELKSYNDLNLNNKKRLNQSLEITRLDDFIKNKKEGLNFYIGESGIKLSGGQKQRLCLARMIYHNKSFNILDEATSEIDTILEKKIMKDLISLTNSSNSLFVISHNQNLAVFFDKLYLLKDKKITNFKQ